MRGEMSITLDKREWAEAEAKLDRLERIDRNKAVGKGLREGGRIVIAAGKRNLAARNQVRTGNLSGSFKTSLRSAKKYIYMGFRRPKGAAAHLVDRGTKERYTRNGKYTGRVRGTLFWTDAVNGQADEARQRMMDRVSKEINRIMNK